MESAPSDGCAEEVHLKLAYRWFYRLGLEDEVPNHLTFSKNRHGRFQASGQFNEVVRRCMTASLVKGYASPMLTMLNVPTVPIGIPPSSISGFVSGPRTAHTEPLTLRTLAASFWIGSLGNTQPTSW